MKLFVSAAGHSSNRWCNSDCMYWLYSYLRVSQINERSTSVTTSRLMSYGILDCRWQPSNNSSISPPQSLFFSLSRARLFAAFYLYQENKLQSLSYLSLSVYLSSPSLSLIPRPCSHPCDVWYVSLVKTTPGRHVDIPPCLFISPRRAECCWVVLINDIDCCTHCLTFSVGARERERQRAGADEKTEKKKKLTLVTVFFPQALFPWKPYHSEGDRESMHRKDVKGHAHRWRGGM